MEEEEHEEVSGEIAGETPRERFKRLASLRTNEILKRLKILGNCANRRTYQYDQSDIHRIFEEIEKRTREVKAKFFDSKEREFKI